MIQKFTSLLSIILIFNGIISAQNKSNIIWSEDFDSTRFMNGLPEGWLRLDNNSKDFYWNWSTVGPRGRYTSPNGSMLGDSAFVPAEPLASTTSSNGFMMLEADYYNTNDLGQEASPRINMDTYFQTSAIDFSENDGAVLRLQHAFRYSGYSFVTHLSLFISTDYNPDNIDSGTWSEISLKDDISPGEYSENPVNVEMNISEYVANEPTVYLRFYMYGSAQYFWMVDDIEIFEPYQNDLILDRFWADYLKAPLENSDLDSLKNWFGGYTNIPVNLAQDFVSFRASISSMGSENQNNVKLNVNINRNGSEVYNQNSEPSTIDFFETAMLTVEQDFTPTQMGHYQVSATVMSNDADQAPNNNSLIYNFDITDTIYSRSTMNPSNYFYISTLMLGGGADGNNLGVLYDIPESTYPIEFNSVTTYIHPYFDSSSVEYENASVIARIYAYNESTSAFGISPIKSSDSYPLTIDDIGSYITLPLLDESNGYAEAGKYLVCLEFYMAGSNHNFLIGNDISVFQPGNAAYVLIGTDWQAIDANPVINLNVKVITSVAEKVNTKGFELSQNYPNPFNQKSTITYSVDNPSQGSIEIYDITGKLVMKDNLGFLSAGKHEYIIKRTNFERGIYLYKVTVGDESKTRRLIIE